MATRNDVRRYGSATSSDFPKVGDHAEVGNVSGAASANTLMALRDISAITAPPPGRAAVIPAADADRRANGPAPGRPHRGLRSPCRPVPLG